MDYVQRANAVTKRRVQRFWTLTTMRSEHSHWLPSIRRNLLHLRHWLVDGRAAILPTRTNTWLQCLFCHQQCTHRLVSLAVWEGNFVRTVVLITTHLDTRKFSVGWFMMFSINDHNSLKNGHGILNWNRPLTWEINYKKPGVTQQKKAREGGRKDGNSQRTCLPHRNIRKKAVLRLQLVHSVTQHTDFTKLSKRQACTSFHWRPQANSGHPCAYFHYITTCTSHTEMNSTKSVQKMWKKGGHK